MRLLPLLLGLSLCFAAAAQTGVGRELVANGGFETAHNGWPDGFAGNKATTKWVEENGNHFVRIASPPGQPVDGGVSKRLDLEPAWFKLKVSIRVRTRDVVHGPEGWQNARVAMDFHDAKGTQVGGWPNVLNWEGTNAEWKLYEREYVIPEGATYLNINPAMFKSTGQVDYDDFSVVVTKLRPKLEDATLPTGVVADWKLEDAWKQETPTRAKVSLNGLWRFIPRAEATPAMPADGAGWGYLKVPASWPGRGVDAVKPLGPDIWDLTIDWAKVTEGWYQRDVTVPASWAGRRLFLDFDLPQTEATVFIGGQVIGSARWPAGRVDVTSAIPAGSTCRVAVHVTTEPFEKERLVAMREDLIEKVKADVKFRGLAGDVFLVAEPSGAHITSVQAQPSVRTKSLGLAVRLAGLSAGSFHLEAVAARDGQQAWRGRSPSFTAADVVNGQVVRSLPWANPVLWDFEQPNLYDLTVSVVPDAGGQAIDSWPTRFGFRELWLDGRNLMLNGTPVHLRALFYGGMTRGDAYASPEAVRQTITAMRRLGFNFFIFGNYGLDPGGTTSFGDILRTADELGFGVSFSLPHALSGVLGSGTELDPLWQQAARYAVDTAGNHPSVLTYAGNHNSLGYHGDQNPEKIDGIHEQHPPASNTWFPRSRAKAAKAEAFVRALDPTRELYHHQSGNMGAWHTVNIYLNWSPAQERSEWLSHWAEQGVKPLFFVEWGPPHQASWGGHRQGPFIWRNKVNSEPLGIEYGAMISGDAAYRPDPVMEKYVDQYERVYARKQPFHISEVLGTLWDSANELNNIDLKTYYTDICWPRLRTWGITAILPWDQGMLIKRVGQAPEPLTPATDWTKLQRPGLAPDELRGGDYWTLPTGTWELTSWGRSLERWNQPLCAYLGGDPARFTERGHNVTAGERLTKQAILVNDTRGPVTLPFTWQLTAGGRRLGGGQGTVSAPPGGHAMVPFTFAVPRDAQGTLDLELSVASQPAQTDRLALHVVQPQNAYLALITTTMIPVAVFDPQGTTLKQLQASGIKPRAVTAGESLDGVSSLIIGRGAISPDGPLPDVSQVLRRGGRVLVMEQTEAALQRRLGFRTNDPSLREVFVRTAGHPVLAGLDNARLADWRGDATLIPPKMDLPADEERDPPKDWLGFDNTRVWKWGNAGQVASVVIEKPQRGDFTALVDGGFDLQYAPLLLHRTGGGQMLFCQMDVTGRTAPDPAADRLWRNLLVWCQTQAAPATAASGKYVGGDDGATLLTRLGVRFDRATAADLSGDGPIIVGPGAGASLVPAKAALAQALASGRTVLVLPQTRESLQGWLPVEVTLKEEARTTSPVPAGLSGVGPSELRWRGRKNVLLIGAGGAAPNVVAVAPVGKGRLIFCQILPTDWDYADPYRVYLKRTADRTATLLAELLGAAGAGFSPLVEPLWNQPAPSPVDLGGAWQAVTDPKGTLTPADLKDSLPWQTIKVPGTFEAQVPAWKDYDGVVWYRRTFSWTGPTSGPVDLRLGAVDDEDWTYLNGTQVGHIGQDNYPDDYWSHPRIYRLPAGVLKPGVNELVVKVRDLRQSGGLVSGNFDLRRPDRWLDSYYLDAAAQLDDPYRYNRW